MKPTKMDRNKSKEKISYSSKLDFEHKARYEEKIRSYLNGFDPYEGSGWLDDVEKIPPLEFGDIVSYLVFGVSAYTLTQFKSYKSLEAYSQFVSGWVHELKIHRPDNCANTVIKTKVMHSMRLSEKPCQPWVVLDDTGKVITAHCDCMAGLAETCTHVGALLFKMEAVVRIREKATVTGVAAYWLVPSSVSKVEPKVGHQIDFTSAAAKKKQLDKAIDGGTTPVGLRTAAPSRVQAPPVNLDDRKAFLQALHNTGDRAAFLSVQPGYCEDFKDPVEPVLLPRSLRSLRKESLIGAPEAEVLAHCETLQNAAGVSKDEASKLERETRAQHHTPAWFAARAGRITASQLQKVCTFDSNRPALSTVKQICYPGNVKINTPAVKWGLSQEKNALKKYEQQMTKEHVLLKTEKSGFVVNPNTPYMGASPDAMVSCQCCGKGCVEIKCPEKHKHSTIVDACKDKAFCLGLASESSSDSLYLKRSSGYFYQVQAQMLATETQYCDFVVWTTVDCVIVRVARDNSFLDECRTKAEVFFKTVVLPEMVARLFTENHPSAKQQLSGSPQKLAPKKNGNKKTSSAKRQLSVSPKKPAPKKIFNKKNPPAAKRPLSVSPQKPAPEK